MPELGTLYVLGETSQTEEEHMDDGDGICLLIYFTTWNADWLFGVAIIKQIVLDSDRLILWILIRGKIIQLNICKRHFF